MSGSGAPVDAQDVAVPDVTVVTVTYDAAALVLDCLDGLAAQDLDGIHMEVVVVDNGSSDGTPSLVEAHHPEVRVVRAGTNLGFAAGNNLALERVRSRYVILLNNDAVPGTSFVRTLVAAMDAAGPDVAAMAATVLLMDRYRPARGDEPGVVEGPDGRWVADPAGTHRLVNSTGNEIRTDGYGTDRGWLADAGRHRPPRDVFGFSGAAAALRTEALAHVGLFDESFFMYYEDTDLSWRLRLAGFRIEHCPAAVVEHHHAASSGEGSDLFRFHDARNRLLMLAKDAPVGFAARQAGRFVLTTASILVRRSQPRHAVLIRLRAFVSFLRLLPRTLIARRRIGRSARVSREQVLGLAVSPPSRPTGGLRA